MADAAMSATESDGVTKNFLPAACSVTGQAVSCALSSDTRHLEAREFLSTSTQRTQDHVPVRVTCMALVHVMGMKCRLARR